MGTGVARDDICRLRFVRGITHACGSSVSDALETGDIPSRALNAGSICPPEATRTASMTFSSTLGNASLRVVLASSLGLRGRGGIAGGAATTVPVAMGAAVGVGSKLLSSELLTC
jgi:hypothetical protein